MSCRGPGLPPGAPPRPVASGQPGEVVAGPRCSTAAARAGLPERSWRRPSTRWFSLWGARLSCRSLQPVLASRCWPARPRPRRRGSPLPALRPASAGLGLLTLLGMVAEEAGPRGLGAALGWPGTGRHPSSTRWFSLRGARPEGLSLPWQPAPGPRWARRPSGLAWCQLSLLRLGACARLAAFARSMRGPGPGRPRRLASGTGVPWGSAGGPRYPRRTAVPAWPSRPGGREARAGRPGVGPVREGPPRGVRVEQSVAV